jgi:hypothetical protein
LGWPSPDKLKSRFIRLVAVPPQFVLDLGTAASRLTTTPTKDLQSGPDCLIASVIDDSNVDLEIDCFSDNSIIEHAYLEMFSPGI